MNLRKPVFQCIRPISRAERNICVNYKTDSTNLEHALFIPSIVWICRYVFTSRNLSLDKDVTSDAEICKWFDRICCITKRVFWNFVSEINTAPKPRYAQWNFTFKKRSWINLCKHVSYHVIIYLSIIKSLLHLKLGNNCTKIIYWYLLRDLVNRRFFFSNLGWGYTKTCYIEYMIHTCFKFAYFPCLVIIVINMTDMGG